MLDCLDNKVVWREVCETPTGSELLINDLPGYPTKAFELLTNQDAITAEKVWQKLQRRAKYSIKSDIEAALSNRFQVRTIVDNITTGYWKDPQVQHDLTSELRGEYISLIDSDNLSVYIESVEVYANGTEDDSIYIYDLERGTLIESIDYTFASAGFYTVEINKSYTARKLFVCYDGSVLQSNLTEQSGEGYFKNICEPCGCTATRSMSGYIDKADTKLFSNMLFRQSSGIRVKYSLQCSLDNWICQNANRIANAYLYLLGVEIATEIMSSDRVNEVTLMHEDKLDAFVSYCHSGYEKELASLSKGAQIKDLVCMPCGSAIKKIIFHP